MALEWLDDELARLRREGLLRTRATPIDRPGPRVVRDGVELINLCSNDYLSLGGRQALGIAGSGASRLVVGDVGVHLALEQALARWLEVESVLLFTSGYAANVGAVAALAGPGSVVVSDALNHASIIDGCRLCRARVVVAPHRDVEAVEAALRSAPERRRRGVPDAYFSQDGTLAPLRDLDAVCARHGAALYVDEAHALGVWGPRGRGLAAQVGVRPDVIVGTLGKSFGAAGAFVAGARSLTEWLWNAARSFVFSTGLAPTAASAALEALPAVAGGERTARLLSNAERVRRGIVSRDTLAGSVGPIVPIVIGDPRDTLAATRALLERGVFVQGIRPPTVPAGTSRLRLTVQADHTPADLERAIETLNEVLR